MTLRRENISVCLWDLMQIVPEPEVAEIGELIEKYNYDQRLQS
jgi:hypothetical protein